MKERCMIHLIMVASEVEQEMRLARCEMTQTVLDGQLGVVEIDNREGWRLWHTGEHLPCPQVAVTTQFQSTATRWERESSIARDSSFL